MVTEIKLPRLVSNREEVQQYTRGDMGSEVEAHFRDVEAVSPTFLAVFAETLAQKGVRTVRVRDARPEWIEQMRDAAVLDMLVVDGSARP
jgi:hypothetical protein